MPRQRAFTGRNRPGQRDDHASRADYLLAPGDQLEIIIHTAPELTRTVTIGPDGQIRMPYSGPVEASARTVEQVQAALRATLASELRNPDLDVLLTDTPSQRIFVGGEVAAPGLYELPGAIDPLQAIILAGGFSRAGSANTVILMRRQANGAVASAIIGQSSKAPTVSAPLQRFDIVFVTRRPIENENLFVRQYVRDSLPQEFAAIYAAPSRDR